MVLATLYAGDLSEMRNYFDIIDYNNITQRYLSSSAMLSADADLVSFETSLTF